MKPTSPKYVQGIKTKAGKLFIIVAITLLLAGMTKVGNAQDPVFSQFYANPMYLNPALAGAERCSRVALNYRNHPFPTFGAFSTYSFSADAFFENISGGVGIHLMHDNEGGLMNTNRASIAYAFHSRLSQNWYANFGLQAGYLNRNLAWDALVFPDDFGGNTNQGSSEVPSGPLSVHKLDLAAGVLVYNGRFYGGLAAHHLNQPRSELFEQEKQALKLTLHAGYEFMQGRQQRGGRGDEGITLSPNIIIQSQSGFYRINYGMYMSISPLVAGAWLRQGIKHPNSLIFLLGIKQVNYAVGYSYDHSLSGFSANGGGAHEIGVLLNFNCAAPNMKYRILNCPSF